MTALLTVLIGLAMGALAIVPLDWKSQAQLGVFTFLVGLILNRVSRQRTITLALILFSTFSSVRYYYWRVEETVRLSLQNPEAIAFLDWIFIVILLTAEAYTLIVLLLGYFQTSRPLGRTPEPLPQDVNQWPAVDVFIPTYNEPLAIVRPTVLASLRIDWPEDKIRVFILDDGRRPEFQEFARECGCEYIIRADNRHAKAGNINQALSVTKGEYIAIFDCDHIPVRSFLQITMGWMLKDKNLGLVQTPHHFYSPDPFERNLGTFRDVPNEGALFYGVVQDGSDFWNGSFFCGSCAVLRRTALDEIGGIAVETVTEDAHTSLRMQRHGWNSAYINIPQAAGLATDTLAAHVGQRIRWARGMVQIFRIDNPLFGRGLKLPQRLCYLNSCLHYLGSGPRLVFLTAPLVFLLLGRANILAYVWAVLAYSFPHLMMGPMTNSRIQGHYRFSFWNEVYEAILAPYIFFPTLIALISPKHGKFNVTAKGDSARGAFFDWHIAWPYAALLFLNLLGAGAGIWMLIRHVGQPGPVGMNVFWTFYNVIILSAALAVAQEPQQRRKSVRVDARFPVKLILADGIILAGETENISNGGAAVITTEPVLAAKGQVATLRFELDEGIHDFPATVVSPESELIRLQFLPMSLESESALVSIVYGRADAWIQWRRGRRDDQPLRSLVQLTGYSVRGFAVMLKSLRPRRQEIVKPRQSLQSPSLPLIILFCCLAGMARMANAQPALPAKAPGAADSASSQRARFTDNLDLSALGVQGPLTLHGTSASTTVAFRISSAKVVDSANMQLRFRASRNLVPQTSKLNISLNYTQIASIPLQPESSTPEPEISASVTLPAILVGTENALTFQLSGNCAFACGSRPEPDIWLEINPATVLHFSGMRIVLANDLRALTDLSRAGTAERPLMFSFVFSGVPTREELEAAGIAASRLGIGAESAGFRMQASINKIPEGDVFFVGRSGAPIPASLGLESQTAPALAMRDNPNDRFGKLYLLIAGDAAQLRIAAAGFALPPIDTGSLVTYSPSVMPPPRAANDAPRWEINDRINNLGRPESDTGRRVIGNGSVNIYFRLPPGLYMAQISYLPLRIRYQCRNLSKEGGALTASINGRFFKSKTLNPACAKGPVTEDFALPAFNLTLNDTLTLDFSFRTPPDSSGTTEPPEATVLADTNLDLSGVSHYVELPGLDLLVNQGYPYTRRADLADTVIALPASPTVNDITAYLNLLAFFGGFTGYPAIRVSVVTPEEAARISNKDVFMISIGDKPEIPEIWASRAPFRYNPSPALVEPDGLFEQLRLLPWSRRVRDRKGLLALLENERPIPRFSLQQFVSPADPQRIVTIFEGKEAEPGALHDEMLAFGHNTSQIFGDVTVYANGRFDSYRVATRDFWEGTLTPFEVFVHWSTGYFLGIPIVVALLAVLLAIVLSKRMERRAEVRRWLHT